MENQLGIVLGEYDAVLSDTEKLPQEGWIQPTVAGTIKYVTVKGDIRTRTFEAGQISVAQVSQVYETGTDVDLGIVVYY